MKGTNQDALKPSFVIVLETGSLSDWVKFGDGQSPSILSFVEPFAGFTLNDPAPQISRSVEISRGPAFEGMPTFTMDDFES